MANNEVDWLQEQLDEYESQLEHLEYQKLADSDEYDMDYHNQLKSDANAIRNSLRKSLDAADSGYSAYWSTISWMIRDDRGWRCEHCHIDMADNRELLHLHHINRNRRDNKESNLKVLCALCHSSCEGHEHLKQNISLEETRKIHNKRADLNKNIKLQKKYLREHFRKNVTLPDRYFDDIITKYGSWLSALAKGFVQPVSQEQAHFVNVANGKDEPCTAHEYAWLSYLKHSEKN